MNALRSTRFGCLVAAVLAAFVILPEGRTQTPHEVLLQQAESRFRAIYDRNEFRPQSFRVDWLADSSGYTVLESVTDAKEKVRVRYDAPSGERTVLASSWQQPTSRSENLSPDGRRIVFSEQGNLHVRDRNSDHKMALTRSAPDGPVSHGHAVWMRMLMARYLIENLVPGPQ